MFDTGTLVPIAFFLSVSFILVGITKVISDGRTRRRLIEAGASPELARAIVAAPKDDPGLYSALRWGILTGAVGLALILIQFLPYRSDEPIVFGVILVFAAAGFLGYYVSVRRLVRSKERGGAATGFARIPALRVEPCLTPAPWSPSPSF